MGGSGSLDSTEQSVASVQGVIMYKSKWEGMLFLLLMMWIPWEEGHEEPPEEPKKGV